MTTTAVIHQPDFLPYPGFFHRLLTADVFIILDNVQFVNNASRCMTHRDLIKTQKGARWLSLSLKRSPIKTNINNICLSQSVDWRKKNIDLIRENYKKAPHYKEIIPLIESIYDKKYQKMIEINMESIHMLMDIFNINTPIKYASSLGANGSKNELLVNILKNINATHYLSGSGAKSYFKSEPFDEANISVIWQKYKPIIYPQLHGDYLPNLSSIDMLFNCGVEESRKLLRSI